MMICEITVRRSSVLVGISLLQIKMPIAVSICGHWLILLSIVPLLCITFVSQYSLHTRRRQLLLRQRLTSSANLVRFESEYRNLISVWIILQSSLSSCLYFLTVIYYNNYSIRSGIVSSINNTSMTSPTCGGAGTCYLLQGVGLLFFYHRSLKGRYVTIGDLMGDESGLNSCKVEVYSEQRYGISKYFVSHYY